jgi:hypothetical protein
MVSVISIDHFAQKENPCYAAVPECSEVTITYSRPNGLQEYQDYVPYAVNGGTVIAFNDLPNVSDPYTLNISTNSGYESIIQFNIYERDMNELFNSSNKPHQFFSFLNSANINKNSVAGIINFDDRCDVGTYGPIIYNVSDGISEEPMDYSLILGNYKNYKIIYSVNGIGHIASQEVWPIAMKWRNWPIVTGVSKTFSGMLKLISEWKNVYDAGLSNEEIAHDASAFLDTAGFTNQMLEELGQTEVMMPVMRFVSGYPDARHGFNETGILPESILNMIKYQSRYETLTALVSNHPLGLQIPQHIKDTEKKKMDGYMLKYVLIAMPEIDPDSVTLEMISQSLDFFNSGQPETRDLQTFLNAIKAERYYRAITK